MAADPVEPALEVLIQPLRDCFYTDWLRDRHGLRKAGRLLELPLDKETATRLHHEHKGERLTRWQGVRHVSPALNAEYQCAALVIAQAKKIARVNLDAVWWSGSRDTRVSRAAPS